MASFIKDVEEIRQRAIEKIEDGPVTATYKGDKDRSVQILNEALATEIVCILRYMHHYFMATGVHGRAVADEFKEHADEEREHADLIAERIQQLGGKPDFNPASLLQRSISQYVEGETLADMIREDLIAERMVIEVYQEMIRYFGDNDPTTRRMIEHILAQEEEHAADLSDLLFIVDPHTGEAEGRDPGTDPLSIAEKGRQSVVSRSRQSLASDENPNEDEQEYVEAGSTKDRGQRRSNPGKDVKGRDREYDGTQPLPRRGAAETSAPGTSGRPMNRRRDLEEDDEVGTSEVASRPNKGGMTGGTRSPKVLQKNRKSKRAA